MSEISTSLRGLLGYLALKQHGDVPRNLSDQVAPILSAEPFFFEGLGPETINTTAGGFDSSIANSVANISAQLFGFSLAQNEMAFVQMAGIYCFSVNAAVSLSISDAYVSFPVGGAGQADTPINSMQGATFTNGYQPYGGDRNFWVPPGGAFGFHVHVDTPAALSTFSVGFRARYVRIRV